MFEKFTYTFQGLENIPHKSWEGYFKTSTIGNDYTCLKYGDTLIMSNTEYETCTNQPLYDLIQEKLNLGITSPNILLIGWGIGFVIPKIQEIAPNANITVVEKYQEVLDLTPPPNGITVIQSDVKDVSFENQTFDIIWSDITETPEIPTPSDTEFLKQYLSESGTFQYWLSNCNC